MPGGAEYQIAIKIAGNLDKSFTSAVSGAQKSLDALGAFGKVGGESMKIAAAAMSGIGAGLAGIGVASINTGREFEAAMSSAAATANANTEEYAKMEAAAMEMGRTTSKTATESANALEYMSLAGWDVDTSIAALPSVLKMSEASGMDLARCSDVVTDSMSAAGVSVGNLSEYLDIATRAQNKSNQTSEQLMEAFIGVGGTMKGLNIPIQDTSTALGVLANRGIKGSEAGTALNAIMTNLTTGTGQAGKMMDKLGISAFDSKGRFIGLEATLQKVNKATKGMTEEERNAALAAIGGKHHIDALNDLMAGLNTTNAEGVSEWKALNQELYNANGALEQMRGIKLDNLNGDLDIFKSALDDAGIRIYKNIQNPMRGAVQFGTEQIYRLSDALTESGFTGMAETVGDVLADCVTEAANAAPRFIQLATTMGQGLVRGLSDNAPAISTAAATLVGTAVTSFLTFYGDFWSTGAELFAQFLQGMAGQAPQIIQTAAQTVQNLSQGLTSQFPAILTAATQIGVYILQGLAAIAPGLLGMGGTLLLQLAQGILNGLPVLTNTAVSIMANFGQYLQANLPAIMATGLNMILALSASIRENAGRLVDGAISLALNLAQGLADSIPVIVSTVPTIVSNIAGVINDNAPKLLAAGVRIIATLAMGIIRAIPVIVANIPKILRAIYDVFTAFNWLSLGRNAMTAIGKGFHSMASAIPNALKNIPNLIKGFFETGANVIKNFGWASLGRGIVQTIALGLSSLPSMFLKIGSAAFQWFRSIDWIGLGAEILQSIVSGLFNLGGAAFDAVKGIGSGIWDSFTGLFTGGGKKAVEAAANGVTEGIPALTAATENAVTSAANGFQFDSGLLSMYGTDAGNNLANGILSSSDIVAASAESVGNSFAAAVPGMTEDAAAAGMALADGMSSGVLAGTESLGGAIGGLGDTVATTLNSAITGNLPDVNAAALASGNAITDGITTGIDSGMGDAATTAANASLETIGAMADGISAGAGTITGTVSDLTATVTGALDQCWTDVSAATNTSWADIGANMQSGLTEMSSGVTESLSVMQSGVSDSMTAFSGTITDTMATAQAAISSGTQGWNAEVSAAMGTLSGTIDTGMASVTASTENAITAMQGTMQTGMASLTATAGESFSALQVTIQASMDSVNQTFTVSIQAMTVTAQTGITTMSGAMQTGFGSMQSTAQASFGAIRASIEGEMNRATAAVQAAVSAMKAAMNFSWKLPDLKVPQVNVSGAFSLEPPTAPQFSVSWHREGGILTGAQIFGMSGNTLLGGGEAGKEAVLPLAVLWPNMAAVMTSVLERSAYPEPEAANIQSNFTDGRSWDESAVNNLPTEALNAFSEIRTQQNIVSGLPPEAMETAVAETLPGMAESLAQNQSDSVTNASYLTDATRTAVSEAFNNYAERTQNNRTSYGSFPTEIVQSAMTTALSNFTDSRIGNQENGISAAYTSFPVETIQNAVTQAMTYLTESHSRNTEITAEYATDVFESAIAESLANASRIENHAYAPVQQTADYAPVFSEATQYAGDAYSQTGSATATENAVNLSSFPETLTNITDARNQSLTAPVAINGAMRTPLPPMASQNITLSMTPAATRAAESLTESQYDAAYSSVTNGGGTVDIYANAVSVNAQNAVTGSAYAPALSETAQTFSGTEAVTNANADNRNQSVTASAYASFLTDAAQSDAMTETLTHIADSRNQAVTLPAYASFTDVTQSDAVTETLTNITDARNAPTVPSVPNPQALSYLPPSETFNSETAQTLSSDNRSWNNAAVTNGANETAVLMVAILPQLLDAIRESSDSSVTDRTNAYLERIEAAEAGNADGSVSDLLSLLDRDGGEPDNGGEDNPAPVIHVTYQPQYHFHGDAPRKEDIEQADRQSRAEFERWAEAWFDKRMRDFSRKSFSRR